MSLTSGAAPPVDPVTATLPVAPACIHSGAASPGGAAVGHALASVAVSMIEGSVITSATEDDDEVDADGWESEPHAAMVRANAAAPVTNATEEGQREKFTVDTLQMRDAATSTRSGTD